MGGVGAERPVAGREPVVANCKLHAQQVGCPSKISTMLAININIISNSMPNRRSPPHFTILQAGRRVERRYDTWQVEPGGLEESRGCLPFLKSESFKIQIVSFC